LKNIAADGDERSRDDALDGEFLKLDLEWCLFKILVCLFGVLMLFWETPNINWRVFWAFPADLRPMRCLFVGFVPQYGEHAWLDIDVSFSVWLLFRFNARLLITFSCLNFFILLNDFDLLLNQTRIRSGFILFSFELKISKSSSFYYKWDILIFRKCKVLQ
jgi:hypothetical protein